MKSLTNLMTGIKLRRSLPDSRNQEIASATSPDSTIDDDVYCSWRSFRADYTSYQLTKEHDMFIALQDIAQDLGDILEDRMFAGLWEKRLIQELCWYKNISLDALLSSRYRPSSWRIPSWSWASLATPTSGSLTWSEMHNVAEVVSFRGDTESPLDSNRVSVLIHCRLNPVYSRDYFKYPSFEVDKPSTLSFSKIFAFVPDQEHTTRYAYAITLNIYNRTTRQLWNSTTRPQRDEH
jgi:hypothetical protein